jgi:hypothetical protein
MECIEKMKRLAPDQFHMLVKMHLSFLLDLNTDDCDCSFVYDASATPATPTKNKGLAFVTPRKKSQNPAAATGCLKSKGVMEGAPLTFEGVCQVFQIIEFLRRPANLKVEGLFRKHGNLKKQQTLKERLNKGINVDLDSEFTVIECAATLKTFLSDLSEPVLTDAYYKAHCQVVALAGEDAVEKKIQSLQLLFLLIPEPNYALLRDLLNLLHLVVENADTNKMTALNLATVFATHVMCPRKLSPDCLQSNHQMYIKAVSFMIEHYEKLFTLPTQVLKDVEMFWKCNSEKTLCESKQSYGPTNSPVVNTIYSFVDRQKTKEASMVSTTETALAELYAQVQAMPESAQKKRLISKLNEANGCGTPSMSTKKRRRQDSSKWKNLLTPKAKAVVIAGPKSGKKEGKNSYNVDKTKNTEDVVSSYKRQDSRGQSSLVSNDDASPVLRNPINSEPSRRAKPIPPPRVSSLKTDSVDLLATPRCRKPLGLGLSPMLEEPLKLEEKSIDKSVDNSVDKSIDKSTTSSVIESEANLLLTGEMEPSDSMLAFLDNEEEQKRSENKDPNKVTPKSSRKRSLTELGGPNPLGKAATPMKNCQGNYFETDF